MKRCGKARAYDAHYHRRAYDRTSSVNEYSAKPSPPGISRKPMGGARVQPEIGFHSRARNENRVVR